MKKCRRLLNETNKVRMDHMTEDFYCDEVFSGKTKVNKVLETDNVLAYYHTKPYLLIDHPGRARPWLAS
ncbi:hypothetical protein BSU04nite_36060 [Bacillus spizizenii]|nr:hypothetical protein BSU04nite_36060 [Bacillus spizizenii]